MIKKLAASGIIGFAITGSIMTAGPAFADGHGHGHGHHGHHGHHGKGHGHGGQFSNNHTSGNGSILGGTQVIAPISIPVDVCGNAVAVLGFANAGCKGGASVNYLNH